MKKIAYVFFAIIAICKFSFGQSNSFAGATTLPLGAISSFYLTGTSIEPGENLGFATQANQSVWFKFIPSSQVMYLQVIKPVASPNISVNIWNDISSLPLSGGLQAFTGQSSAGPQLDTITFFDFFFIPGKTYYVQILGYNIYSQIKIRGGAGIYPMTTYISNGPSSGSLSAYQISSCEVLSHVPSNNEIINCLNYILIQPQRKTNSVFDFYIKFTPKYSSDTTFFKLFGFDSAQGVINTNKYAFYKWWAYSQGSATPFASGSWGNSFLTGLTCNSQVIIRFSIEHSSLANPYKYFPSVWGKTPFQCISLKQTGDSGVIYNTEKPQKINIYNGQGEKVATSQVESGQNKITGVSPGVYFWRSESGSKSGKYIIIQK